MLREREVVVIEGFQDFRTWIRNEPKEGISKVEKVILGEVYIVVLSLYREY